MKTCVLANRRKRSTLKLAAVLALGTTLGLAATPAAALYAEATAYATLGGLFNKQTVKDFRLFSVSAQANAIRQNGNTVSTAKAQASSYRHGTFLNKISKTAIGSTYGNPNNWWQASASTGAFVVVDSLGGTGTVPIGFSIPSAGTPAEGSPIGDIDAAGNPYPTQTLRAGGTGLVNMTMSSTLIQGSGENPLFSGGMELRRIARSMAPPHRSSG